MLPNVAHTPDQLAALLDLNPAQAAFALAYLETGKATSAARVAGWADPIRQGWAALRNPRISAALDQLRRGIPGITTSSIEESLDRLTSIARDPDVKPEVRISATNSLLKVQGAMGPETYVDARSQKVVYQIGAEASTDTLQAMALLLRLADGEPVSPEEARDCLSEMLPKNILDAGSNPG